MIASDYLEIGAAGWRWVLDQVRWDDGPWIPETTADAGIPDGRDGMHSGTAGLAPALAEIRLARSWTDEEQALADGIVDRIRRRTAAERDVSYFLGLTSGIGALGALGAETTDSLARIRGLATPDGWSQDIFGPPRNRAGAPVNDVVIGAAGVALGAIWAGGTLGDEVAGLAADVLMGRAEQLPTGLNWPMISPADLIGSRTDMPNFSHGTAGVATALALTGHVLGRDDLVRAARLGAEHLVTLGSTRGGGFAVPHYLPRGDSDEDEVTYTWCHGPTGRPCCSSRSTGRESATSPVSRPSRGRRGVCTVCATPGCRSGCTRVSGTTTVAAAVRRGWATCSSTATSGQPTRPTCSSPY